MVVYFKGDMSILRRIGRRQVVYERLDLARQLRERVREDAAEDLALLVGLHVEARHDAEVVAAAPERTPQVRVRAGARVDDFAGGEDDFVIDYLAWERY